MPTGIVSSGTPALAATSGALASPTVEDFLKERVRLRGHLRRLKKRFGSGLALANKIHLDQGYMSRVLRGERLPDVYVALKVHLGIPGEKMDELLDDDPAAEFLTREDLEVLHAKSGEPPSPRPASPRGATGERRRS